MLISTFANTLLKSNVVGQSVNIFKEPELTMNCSTLTNINKEQ